MGRQQGGSARANWNARRRRRFGTALTWSIVVVGLLAVTVAWLRPDDPDDFYTYVADIEAAAPGEVLRQEAFDTGVPPDTEAWRVLYRTTDTHGDPAVASALLLVPTAPPTLGQPDGPAPGPPGALPGIGNSADRAPDGAADDADTGGAADDADTGHLSRRPLLVVGHGSTGADRSCAPSLSARPLASLPPIDDALASGWAVVAPDYLGLGTEGPHPYLVGSAAAHTMLDAARAAARLVEVDRERVAVWGFSQGGHAALFTAELQPTYAPDTPLAAVVAFAPPTALGDLITRGQGSVLGTLVLSTTAVTWSEVYPELELTDVVSPDSIEDARQVARRCLDPTSLPASVVQSIQLRGALVAPGEPGTEDWLARIDENTPRGGVDVPVLVIQAANDVLLDSGITTAHVADRCAGGDLVALEFVDGVGHFTLGGRAGRIATAWTADRFAKQAFEPCQFALPDSGEAAQETDPETEATRPEPSAQGAYDPDAPLLPLEALTEADLRDRRLPTIRRLPPPADDTFVSEVEPARSPVLAGSTWHSGCPIDADDLRHVTVSHWGFDGLHHTGEMLVHADAAEDLVNVFRRLHELRYPIEELRIVAAWELDLPPTGHGNTSTVFVCRNAVGGPRWSEHAFGLAVDLNPFQNPYRRGGVVLPELSGAYLDRADHRPGMIQPGDDVVEAFASIGWRWGGNWTSAKDWMHFSATGR